MPVPKLTQDGLPIFNSNSETTSDGLPILKKKAVSQTGGYGSQLGSTTIQDTKDLLSPTSKRPAAQKVTKVQNNKPSSLDRNLQIYAQAQGTPMAEVVKNIPIYKSEVRQGTADRGFFEKVLDGAGYIASGFNKGLTDIVTGLAVPIARTGVIPFVTGDQMQAGIEKASTPFLASKQQEGRYGETPLLSQIHALSQFIPASVGAAYTGGATFYLNGYGNGLNEVKKMKDEGVKFENGSDDVYAIGRGVIDLLLMSRLNSHTVFAKLPQSLRDNVVKNLSMDAMGEVGKLGTKATAQDIVNLFKKKAIGFDTKFRQFGTNYLKSYAMTTIDLNALNAANFGLGKISNAMSGTEMFQQTPEDLLEGAKKIVTLEAPIFAGFGAVKSAGQLIRKSEYTNEVISNLYKDASPENVELIKTELAKNLQERDLTPEEIQNSVNQVDKLATIAKTLPADGRLKLGQFKEGIELIDGREELRQQLADIKASRETLDESVRDIPRPEEQLIEAKLEQANDKLKELAAGGKYKYDFDPINDVYTKQLNDSPAEQISKERFDLEGLEKAFAEETKQARNKEKADQKISDFVDRTNAGEDMSSPEDIDFYNKNKNEIDNAIQKQSTTGEAPKEAIPQEKPELIDVQSTAEFIRSNNLSSDISQKVDEFFLGKEGKDINDIIAEEYHKAKKDGSNPKLVKAVEESVPEVVEKTQAPQEFISEKVSRLRAKEQAEYDAMKDPNDAVKRKKIYDKYNKPISEAIREAKKEGVRTVKLEVNEDLTNNGIGLRAVEMPDGKFGIFQEVDGKVTGKSLGRSFETIEELKAAYEGGIKDRLTADAIKKAEAKAPSEPFNDTTIKPDPNIIPEETIPGLENEGKPLIFQSEKYQDAKEILETKGDVISDAKKAKLQEIVDMGDAELAKLVDGKTEKLKEKDTTGMPEDQKATFDAVTNIDKSKLNSDQLIQLNEMIDKYNETGKFFDKRNTIEDLYKIQQSATPETLGTIKEGSLEINALTDALENWATLATKIQAVVTNEKVAAVIRVFTGLSEHIKQYGSKKGFEGEADKTFKELGALLKKTKVDKSYESQLKIGVVNDLVQHAEGMTPEQVQVEFLGRKKALADGIAEGKKQMAASAKYAKEQGQAIEILDNLYKKYVENANTPEDIKNMLTKDEADVRNFMLAKFAGMTEGLNNLSRVYKGKEFDKIKEYFPRMYVMPKVRNPKSGKDIKGISSNLTDIADFASESPEMKLDQSKSTAFDERTLEKDMLPEEKLVNYNALDVFQDNYRKQAYDLYTMKSRSYMSKVLNSPEFLEALNGDKDLLGYYQKAYTQRIKNEKSQLRRAEEGSLLTDLGRFARNTGNRIALGGLATPFFKQWGPTMASLMINTGDSPQAMSTAIGISVMNNKAYKELLASSPISRRSKQESQFLNGQTNATDVKNIGNMFRRAIKGWDETMNTAFMTALKKGDQTSAGVSWMTHYIKNTVERGKYKNYSEFDIEAEAKNPDPIAKEYAEQMTSTTLNVNENVDRAAKQVGGGWLPFVSFSVNAKANLLTNVGKITTSYGSLSFRDKVTIGQRVAAHVAEIIAINKISALQRRVFIAGSGLALKALIGATAGNEEDDKKVQLFEMVNKYTKEAIEKNNNNAKKYIVQDLITGQIAGNYTDRMVEDVLEAYNVSSAAIMGKEPVRAPRTFRQYEIFKLMGVYGIPIVNGFEALENLSKFVEPSSVYRQQKFGYIDPYDKIKIEDGKEDFKRPDWARYSQGAVGLANLMSLVGGSFSEVSAITRRLPQITGGMEKEIYGNDRNLESKFLKDQSSPYGYTRLEDDQATIGVDGEYYYLKPEQLKEWKKFKAQALAEVTREEILEMMKELKEAGYPNPKREADKRLNQHANKEARGAILDKYVDANDNILLDKKDEVKKK